MGTAIKHPVPDRGEPSFVIFDIRALWRLTRSGTGCFIVVLLGKQWASKDWIHSNDIGTSVLPHHSVAMTQLWQLSIHYSVYNSVVLLPDHTNHLKLVLLGPTLIRHSMLRCGMKVGYTRTKSWSRDSQSSTKTVYAQQLQNMDLFYQSTW